MDTPITRLAERFDLTEAELERILGDYLSLKSLPQDQDQAQEMAQKILDGKNKAAIAFINGARCNNSPSPTDLRIGQVRFNENTNCYLAWGGQNIGWIPLLNEDGTAWETKQPEPAVKSPEYLGASR